MKQDNENRIIEIHTFFHPIISIRDRSIVAMEALSRYRFNSDRNLGPINNYIETLSNNEELLKLDLQLIKTSVKTFQETSKSYGNILLFLNVSSVIVNLGNEGILLINRIIYNAGMTPRQVVLEILEENLDNSEDCNNFFISSRKEGYSLALDDVGVGFSNLQRIAQVKPNIIKLDISLISNLHLDYYKRKVFSSLTRLAHDIGALVVAEGVENEKETLMSLKLGAVLVQGFYFCKPNPSICSILKICKPKIEICRVRLKETLQAEKRDIKLIKQEHAKSVAILSNKLSRIYIPEFEVELLKCMNINSDMECLFILDCEGIQVTETITIYKNNSNKHFLFKPASRGADHSLKPYYTDSDSDSDNFNGTHVTDKYISQASGKACRTFSNYFYNNNKLFILCVDYSENDISI